MMKKHAKVSKVSDANHLSDGTYLFPFAVFFMVEQFKKWRRFY